MSEQTGRARNASKPDSSGSPAAAPAPERAPSADELALLAALRNGDERAFTTLVDRHHAGLLRLARIYVGSHALAEEVVQEAWLGVIQGLASFEGRSSLKTWIFRILTNRAKTRAEREGRYTAFAALSDGSSDAFEAAVEPDRFLAPGHPDWRPEWHRHWTSPPRSWGQSPEKELLSREARDFLQRAVDQLPPNQRTVVTLRDIQQWSAEEVCNVLGISETNQRVLLHRARSKVRRALEDYFARK